MGEVRGYLGRGLRSLPWAKELRHEVSTFGGACAERGNSRLVARVTVRDDQLGAPVGGGGQGQTSCTGDVTRGER